MDQRSFEMTDSDATDGVNLSTNHNKPVNQVDIDIETNNDEYSQDLFDFSADITSLTQTPKIGRELSSPHHPTVPTIPKSLVPFISNVNESWTSDLETPQAKTAAEINLQRIERGEHLSKSCEIMERKICDTMGPNGVIPDVTTPNGCFVTKAEDEDFPTSPILNTMKKRRRPKRRILKSLIDTTIQTDSFKEIGNICYKPTDDNVGNDIKNFESETTLPQNNTSFVNNATFVVDESCSVHNSNIHLTQDEIKNGEMNFTTEDPSAIDNVRDSTLVVTDEEECLMNQRFQSSEEFGEIDPNNTLKNEEKKMRGSSIIDSTCLESSVNKTHEESLAELVKEITELEENIEPLPEYKYADIPMDVFTRDAEALEIADTIPMRPSNSKSNVKKQWGLISFTQLCLLEQENCEDEVLGVDESKKSDSSTKVSESAHNIREDKFITAESAAPAFRDDGNSSLLERDEPVIDIDEFSPWFYQSNDVKSEFLNSSSTAENLNKENAKSLKAGLETATEQKIAIGEENEEDAAMKNGENIHRNTKKVTSSDYRLDKNAETSINSLQSYSSIGFSMASGKRITVNEDKIKKAVKLYDTIAKQVASEYNGKILCDKTGDHVTSEKENKTTIPGNSYGSMGFSTASRRPMMDSKDESKVVSKSNEEIARQDALICQEMREDYGTNNKENETVGLGNSYCSMGFSTAGGKPLKVNEGKLKKAAKMYNDINLTDDFQPKVDSLKIPMARGIKRRLEPEETDSHQIYGADFSLGSKTAMKKAKTMYQSTHVPESELPRDINSAKELVDSVDQRRNGTITKNYDDRCKTDIKSTFPNAFGDENSSKLQRLPSTACAKSNIVSNIKQSKYLELEAAVPDNSINELHKTDDGRKRTSKIFDQQEHLFKKREFVDHTKSKSISNPTISASVGFSTASGKGIQISKQALSNARILLEVEEQKRSESDPLNYETDNRTSVLRSSSDNSESTKILNQASLNAGILMSEKEKSWKSSPLNCIASNKGVIEFSEDALLKSKKLLAEKPGDISPANSSLKHNSVAIKTPASNSALASKTPVLNSVSENISSDETPVGVSNFQSSKRIRFNSDLQARKLFGDTDEETEYQERFNAETNKNPRTPLNSNSNYAHHLLSHRQNQNASFLRDSAVGMYAKSEMFEAYDRLGVPKLEAQKSSPSNQDPDTMQFENKFNKRLAPKRKDRRMSTYSDEITASTEALLADEENSLDGKNWASAITCSPTLVEDREISVKPITVGSDAAREAPSSPRIGAKFRSRRKVKRHKRNSLKNDGASLRNVGGNGCTANGGLDGQIVSQDSQQSSGVATPTSDSSKESHKSVSRFIDTALVSRLEKLEETSKRVQTVDNQFENSEGVTRSEIENRETIEDFLENRLAATLEQEKRIRAKKKNKPKPIPGSLFLRKTGNRECRVSWLQITHEAPPTQLTSQELTSLGIGLEVMEVTAANALEYKFKCIDFCSKDEMRVDENMLEIGDSGRVIFDENGYAGVAEFEQAFIASPGVDPDLLPQRWVENHYRWIVWKLASMDRTRFGELSMPRMLTPRHVMEQLKYRYDREIDKSQRPALRRIMEKDDPPCRRMVLCVATITKFEDIQGLEKSPRIVQTSQLKVELTDGWYSITATIDSAMAHLIAFGKVREGTKLVTCRAELLNCEQGCFPLEIPSETSLKIHTNSTRRARWDAKLGYCKYTGPIPTLLSAVLPYGGLIGRLNATIARVYPIQYFEKTSDGQSVFRNNKCEDKAAMTYEKKRQAQIDAIYAQARAKFEARNRRHSKIGQWNDGDPDSDQQSYDQESEEAFRNEMESILRDSLPPPRKVTVVLKVRVMEGDNIAILTVWSPSEDIIDVIKEGNRVSIHNVQTSGRRSGELQLTAGHQSFVKPEKTSVSSFPRRCLTSIQEIAVAGFNPPFCEFDTVGIVVSLGPAPHGMKNFEVVNLACPANPEGSDSAYLSILFWEGIGVHGFSDILSVGATVACTNIQWRRGAPRTIPMAYSTENSTFTRNPRQIYLRSAFDSVKNQIKDLATYVSQCASEIEIEHQKKPSTVRSPALYGTPSKVSPSAVPLQDKFISEVSTRTPQSLVNQEGTTPAKYSIQRRLEKLQWYGEPPDLSPVSLNHSSNKINQKFIPPARTPEQLECASRRIEVNLKK